MSLDQTIFWFLNSLAGNGGFSDGFWIFVTNYLPYVLMAVALVALIVWRQDLRNKIKIVAVFAVTFGLSHIFVIEGLNKLWPRLRPFDTLQGVTELVSESGFSFPSKHALLTFLLAAYVYNFNKRLGVWLYIFAALVAISRVVVGVHYPSDVLVGAILGILIGLLVYKICKKI